MISDKLIKENGQEVGNDELRAYMKIEIVHYFGTLNLGEDTGWTEGCIDRMIQYEKQVDSSYRRLITNKLFNWVEKHAKRESGNCRRVYSFFNLKMTRLTV